MRLNIQTEPGRRVIFSTLQCPMYMELAKIIIALESKYEVERKSG